MMRDVTFFALASSHVVDRELIDALLEIHHAVHFNVEHPRAGDLLRAHRGRDYLDRVAEELRWAVRAGRLHIERLEPPSLLDIPMKAEEPHGSNAPDDVESPPYDEQIVFKDARAEPIEGRLRYRITNQADPQQLREGDSPSQGEVERFSTSVAQSLARAFRYAKFKFEE